MSINTFAGLTAMQSKKTYVNELWYSPCKKRQTYILKLEIISNKTNYSVIKRNYIAMETYLRLI